MSRRNALSTNLFIISIGTVLLPSCFIDAASDDENCVGAKCDGYGEEEDLRIASALPEHCGSDEAFRIDRPVSSEQVVDGEYSYGFRYKAASKPGAPVLVYLPGGPGQASMDHAPGFVPEGWGYLMTDPRGVGCNTLATLPRKEVSSAFFRTEEIARDVVAAIKDRDLTDYVVFGISYGTLLGTTVAYELEQDKVAPPTAVVLEGVLGRAFGDDFVGGEYIKQWDRVRTVLPADVLTELDTKAAPFGISSLGWSRILGGMMPMGPVDVANYIASLTSTTPEATRQEILAELNARAAAVQLTAPGEVEMYRQVACREIMDTVPSSDLDVVFKAGKLVRNSAEEGTKCKELTVTDPFDSKQQQFSAKTYYFLGDSDVATPHWQGMYHFTNHTGPSVNITTVNGGHNPLEYNQLACAPSLMASIAAGGADLSTALAGCPMPTTVTRK